jgi:hypothetical protein
LLTTLSHCAQIVSAFPFALCDCAASFPVLLPPAVSLQTHEVARGTESFKPLNMKTTLAQGILHQQNPHPVYAFPLGIIKTSLWALLFGPRQRHEPRQQIRFRASSSICYRASLLHVHKNFKDSCVSFICSENIALIRSRRRYAGIPWKHRETCPLALPGCYLLREQTAEPQPDSYQTFARVAKFIQNLEIIRL